MMIKDSQPHIEAVRDATIVEKPGSRVDLPVLLLIAAIGILVIALADNAGRSGQRWSPILYWSGLLLFYVPISARLLSDKAARIERIALVLILGLGFYLVKLFYSPLAFKFPDELQHYRTLIDILRTGHLFSYNHALPVSTFYPGLEIVTDAFIQFSGLPIFEAGVIVMAVARILLTLAFFCAYEVITGSEKIAGVASALYMTNPHYLFLNSFFIYQSLGIALVAFGLYVLAKGDSANSRTKVGYEIIFLLTFTAVIVTHHLTSYFVLFLLLLWVIAAYPARQIHSRPILSVRTWILGLVMVSVWIAFVADNTLDYFEQSFLGVLRDIANLLTGHRALNQVFQPPGGPMLERVINMGVVALIGACLLPSCWFAWRRYRKSPLAAGLIIGSLTYYGSIVIRVASSHGAEFAGRSWSFVFLMTAAVLAIGIEEARTRWLSHRRALPVFTALMTLMLVGGIIGGWPPAWERLPGPYQVGAFESSVEPQGIAAANWMLAFRGRANRIAGDFVNQSLMGSYGQQDPVRGVYRIFYAPGRDPEDITKVQDYFVRYLVVDQRMSRLLPPSGRYFDTIDPRSYRYTTPIDPVALNKFDQWRDVSRVFDSGDIVIYDLHKLHKKQ